MVWQLYLRYACNNLQFVYLFVCVDALHPRQEFLVMLGQYPAFLG